MNKKVNIIAINGLRGLFMIVFVIFGLVAGFIISPSWVCMKVWNSFIASYYSVSSINLYQGMLFWAIIVLSFYALNRKRPLIDFFAYPQLSKEQINEIIQRSKASNPEIFGDFDFIKDTVKKNENKE